MQLEDTLESDCVYSQQNIVVAAPSVICNAALLYPETGNILEIFCVSVSGNLKRCLH